MFKSIIIATAITLTASSAFALDACGPSVEFGFEQSDTTSDMNHMGADNWDQSMDDGFEKGVTAGISLTWQFGWKKKCEASNAAEIARTKAETAVSTAEARSLEAQTKESEAIAEQAIVSTLIEKITFCIDTQSQYAEMGKDLPKSIRTLCGDLI